MPHPGRTASRDDRAHPRRCQDDEAIRALRMLEAAGVSQSAAIRTAVIEQAHRLRRRSRLAAEVAAPEADDDDRKVMLAVAALLGLD